ncbi:hypothetical protein OROGR_007353 [Orobanche gracilis]
MSKSLLLRESTIFFLKTTITTCISGATSFSVSVVSVSLRRQ